MPGIHNIPREQCPSLSPISRVVVGDFTMHPAGLAGVSVRKSALAPLSVVFDTVRRVRHHQVRLHAAKRLGYVVSVRSVATHQPVLPKYPDVPTPRHGRLWWV